MTETCFSHWGYLVSVQYQYTYSTLSTGDTVIRGDYKPLDGCLCVKYYRIQAMENRCPRTCHHLPQNSGSTLAQRRTSLGQRWANVCGQLRVMPCWLQGPWNLLRVSRFRERELKTLRSTWPSGVSGLLIAVPGVQSAIDRWMERPNIPKFCETHWRHHKPFWVAPRWKQSNITPLPHASLY